MESVERSMEDINEKYGNEPVVQGTEDWEDELEALIQAILYDLEEDYNGIS